MTQKQIQKVQPVIKNVYRKQLKPCLNVKKIIGLTFFALSAVFGGANVIREGYEKINTDNPIVEADLGFGSFVLVNKDSRSAIQIYKDALDTALNVPGLQEFYNNPDMPIEQKRAFIKKFTQAVAESAGINIDDVVFLSSEKLGEAQGKYTGLNNKYFSFSNNVIVINETLLNNKSMARIMEVAFHETTHAIEGINIQTNKNVDNLDKILHNYTFTYGKKVYYSNFKEITAALVSNKFRMEMEEKFSGKDIDYTYYGTYSALNDILYEILENDMIVNKRVRDDYSRLSINDILKIGIQNNYNDAKVVYSIDSYNASYTYEIIDYFVPAYMLNALYQDFYIGNLQYRNLNLNNELKVLDENISNFNSGNYYELLDPFYTDSVITDEDCMNMAKGNLAKQVNKIVSIIRYNENLSDEERYSALQTVVETLPLLSIYSIEFYGLDKLEDLQISLAQTKLKQKISHVKIVAEQDKELIS